MGKINFWFYEKEDKSASVQTEIELSSDTTVLSLNNVVSIKGVEFKDKELYVKCTPKPITRVLHDTIRVFEGEDSDCYEDVEVYINQKNGLWSTSGQSITIDVDDCCGIGSTNNEIRIDTEEWITKISCDVIDYECVTASTRKTENVFYIDVSLTDKSEDVFDCPIIVSGFDSDDNLLNQIILYVTFDCTDSTSSTSSCILDVKPSKIIIPFGKYTEISGNTAISYTVFSPTNSKLSINTSTSSTDIDILANTVNSGVLKYSGIFDDKDYKKTLLGENDKTSKEDITKTVEFRLVGEDGGCDLSGKTEVTLKGEEYYFENIEASISSTTINEEYVYIFFSSGSTCFNTEGHIDGSDKTIEDNVWHRFYYKDEFSFTIKSSTECYIYSYDSSIFDCSIKKGNNNTYTFTIKLINYEAIDTLNPTKIILKNLDGSYFTFYCAVDEGLVEKDLFEMYWCKLTETTTRTTAETELEIKYYQEEDTPVDRLHSACRIVDDEAIYYGDWQWYANRNVSYSVKQYQMESKYEFTFKFEELEGELVANGDSKFELNKGAALPKQEFQKKGELFESENVKYKQIGNKLYSVIDFNANNEDSPRLLEYVDRQFKYNGEQVMLSYNNTFTIQNITFKISKNNSSEAVITSDAIVNEKAPNMALIIGSEVFALKDIQEKSSYKNELTVGNLTYDLVTRGKWVDISLGTKDVPPYITTAATTPTDIDAVLLNPIYEINVFVQDEEPKTNFDVGDIWISTPNTFMTTTIGHIDFIQTKDRNTKVSIDITHDPVIAYNIYTDQDDKYIYVKQESSSGFPSPQVTEPEKGSDKGGENEGEEGEGNLDG